MKYITLLLTLLCGVVLADANVDLGDGKTRFDLAREWCQEKRDPSLTYYIIADGTRVVMSASCAQFLKEEVEEE